MLGGPAGVLLNDPHMRWDPAQRGCYSQLLKELDTIELPNDIDRPLPERPVDLRRGTYFAAATM